MRIPDANVRATSRNHTKAKAVLGKLQKDYPGRLEIWQCDMGKRSELREAIQGVDQVNARVWANLEPFNFCSKSRARVRVY